MVALLVLALVAGGPPPDCSPLAGLPLAVAGAIGAPAITASTPAAPIQDVSVERPALLGASGGLPPVAPLFAPPGLCQLELS